MKNDEKLPRNQRDILKHNEISKSIAKFKHQYMKKRKKHDRMMRNEMTDIMKMMKTINT